MKRLVPRLRALYGATLMLAPATIVGALSRDRPQPRELLLARALGIRHVAQAAVIGGSHDACRIRTGATIDALHCGSMILLAAARPQHRVLAMVSAFISAALACGDWAAAHARCVARTD